MGPMVWSTISLLKQANKEYMSDPYQFQRLPHIDGGRFHQSRLTKTKNTLVDAWSGDHLGLYSSLGAVDRIGPAETRSYAAIGDLKFNLGRQNLKVLTKALVAKVALEKGAQNEAAR